MLTNSDRGSGAPSRRAEGTVLQASGDIEPYIGQLYTVVTVVPTWLRPSYDEPVTSGRLKSRSPIMKTTIAAVAATVLAMGAGSAYAQGGDARNQLSGSLGETANPPRSIERAPSNNMDHAVSFMAMGGQVSFPPGYKP
jgi:hypothetical protein